MRVLLSALFAWRRWSATRKLRRADRELYRVRRYLGSTVMISACTGARLPDETIRWLYQEQSRLIARCEELGAIAGVRGPYGEPR